jgi:hypothetical protein
MTHTNSSVEKMPCCDWNAAFVLIVCLSPFWHHATTGRQECVAPHGLRNDGLCCFVMSRFGLETCAIQLQDALAGSYTDPPRLRRMAALPQVGECHSMAVNMNRTAFCPMPTSRTCLHLRRSKSKVGQMSSCLSDWQIPSNSASSLQVCEPGSWKTCSCIVMPIWQAYSRSFFLTMFVLVVN